ncbi:MAG: YigZ family protein [Sphaerochaetaceae bacterium]|nr:YigZ family protein [Sphaerochaetaceae bacterium]
MLILKTERQVELVVKKSRFIAIARKCTTPAEVKTLVDETRRLHPSANHVVHCAVMGNQFSFSDDREPKNTAGRPAFEVLKGSGISNICVLIVRYFGGTLLGTGGLVKAYGDSVKAVLDGIETEELTEKTRFSLVFGYEYYESLKRVFAETETAVEQEAFGTHINIIASTPKDNYEELIKKVSDLTNGKTRPDTISDGEGFEPSVQ